jgi:hypothetical protein
VGAALSRTAVLSSRSELPLAGVLCCGDGSVEVPPRGRHVGTDDRVPWGSGPWAQLSSRRRLLQRRRGLAKVIWRLPGSSSPLFGEGDDDLFTVVLRCSSSSPSCGYAETEIGDFPSASNLPGESRFPRAPGGSGGGSAAARLRSASVAAEEWVELDLVVIFDFFGVLCTAVLG